MAEKKKKTNPRGRAKNGGAANATLAEKRKSLFPALYVACGFNGSEAGRQLGLTDPANWSNRMLKDEEIQRAIEEEKRKRQQECGIDASYVLLKIYEQLELDVIDIIKEDLSGFKPLNEWPAAWRKSISAMDLKTVIIASKGQEPLEVTITKLKWPDKQKALEQIGNHAYIQAFKQSISLTADDSLAELIRGARDRVAGAKVNEDAE